MAPPVKHKAGEGGGSERAGRSRSFRCVSLFFWCSHHHAEVLEDECNKDTYQCRAWCNHHRARKCTRAQGIMRWARVFLVPWLTEESYFYSLHSEQARVVMPCARPMESFPRGASGVSYLSEAYNQIGIQGPRRLRHEKQQTPSVFGTESHYIGKRVSVHFFCIVVQMNSAFWVLQGVLGGSQGGFRAGVPEVRLCSVSALVMAVEEVMKKWKWQASLRLLSVTTLLTLPC